MRESLYAVKHVPTDENMVNFAAVLISEVSSSNGPRDPSHSPRLPML
jgi:hypothetical protein